MRLDEACTVSKVFKDPDYTDLWQIWQGSTYSDGQKKVKYQVCLCG